MAVDVRVRYTFCSIEESKTLTEKAVHNASIAQGAASRLEEPRDGRAPVHS